MPDITIDIDIHAPPNDVYEALTSQNHVEHWWTPDTVLEPAEGTQASFQFRPHGDFAVVTIEKLEPPGHVRWLVTESLMMQTDEWVHTAIDFELSETEKGTALHFEHSGWKEESECYQKCTDGWRHFLDSLTHYLETGKGTPHDPEAEK
jgi:uncharacterized protein YndB with AHSA1/START domain